MSQALAICLCTALDGESTLTEENFSRTYLNLKEDRIFLVDGKPLADNPVAVQIGIFDELWLNIGFTHWRGCA